MKKRTEKLSERPKVTRFNIGDNESYYQLNSYYNWAEKHIESLEAEVKRLTEELAKKNKPTRQEIMNRRFTI